MRVRQMRHQRYCLLIMRKTLFVAALLFQYAPQLVLDFPLLGHTRVQAKRTLKFAVRGGKVVMCYERASEQHAKPRIARPSTDQRQRQRERLLAAMSWYV